MKKLGMLLCALMVLGLTSVAMANVTDSEFLFGKNHAVTATISDQEMAGTTGTCIPLSLAALEDLLALPGLPGLPGLPELPAIPELGSLSSLGAPLFDLIGSVVSTVGTAVVLGVTTGTTVVLGANAPAPLETGTLVLGAVIDGIGDRIGALP